MTIFERIALVWLCNIIRYAPFITVIRKGFQGFAVAVNTFAKRFYYAIYGMSTYFKLQYIEKMSRVIRASNR